LGRIILRTPSLKVAVFAVGLNAVRQGQRALEGTIGPLYPVEDMTFAFFLVLVLGPLLALEGELRIAHGDVDVAFTDTGQLGRNRQSRLVLGQIHARRKRATHAAAEPILK
jgi:hypothetical protein